MINNGLLYDHWKKEQKFFETCQTGLKHRLIAKKIHDIRVAIKKLKAYLKLFFLLQDEKETEPFLLNTNNLFKTLGRQREIEICAELTIIYEEQTNYTLPLWKNFLKQLLKTSKGWSSHEIQQYNNKELPKIALLLKQKCQLHNSRNFQEKIKSIINNLLPEFTMQLGQPHEMRKKLKEIYYWIPLSSIEENKYTFQPKVLHEILEDLGNWQDYEILQTRIKHFRKDFLPKILKEQVLIKEFEEVIKEKKKKLLQSAIPKINNWLKDINEKSED